MPDYFSPKCSLPPETANFVSGPDVRGTLDILWTSLTIIFLCTWSIQHLTIPPQVNPQTFIQRIRRSLFLARRKALWMLIALFAPEWVFALAFTDLVSAMANKKEMKKWAEEDGVPWGISHAFFANMGGIVIRFPLSLAQEEANVDLSGSASNNPANFRADSVELEHGPLVHSENTEDHVLLSTAQKRAHDSKNGLAAHVRRNSTCYSSYGTVNWRVHPRNKSLAVSAISKVRFPNTGMDPVISDFIADCQGDIWVLDARQLTLARELGLIDLPHLSEDDLEDKSKGDAIAKLLALLQVTWLVTQLIVRKIHGLASSQLEIVTLAFAACSGMTYGILWMKPQDVMTPHYVTVKREPKPQELAQLAELAPEQFIGKRHTVWMPQGKIPSKNKDEDSYTIAVVAAVISSFVFGSIHLLAWNSHFPTPVESLLWRIGSLITAALPVLGIGTVTGILVLSGQFGTYPPWYIRRLETLGVLLTPLFAIAYILARLFISVEIFRTLGFLPVDAYVGTWATNVPHLG